MEALRIKGLKKIYKGGMEALKGVDLSIAEGDFFALLGANGAGKTTLTNVTVGLVIKTDGKVTVFGVDQDSDPDTTKLSIGIVPQEFNFNIFETPLEIVVTQGGFYGMTRRDALVRTEELLKALGLWEKKDTQAIRLSGGMKRRLMIARALVHRPRLLILDEPTAGVDVELRRGMWEYLRALNAAGTTILLTTHYLEEVEQLCKNMTIIQRGAVVKSGSVQTLLAEASDRRYRVTLAEQPTEAQVNALRAEAVNGTVVTFALAPNEPLDAVFARAREVGVHIHDVAPAQNRVEELYLSTLNGA